MYSAEVGNKELKFHILNISILKIIKKKKTFDQVKHEVTYLTVFKIFNSKTIFDDLKN